MELIILAMVMNLALSTVDWNHRPRADKASSRIQTTHS